MNKKYPIFFLTWFDEFSRVPYPGFYYILIDFHQRSKFRWIKKSMKS